MYLNQFDEKETVRQTGLLTGASRLIGNAWSGTEEGTRGMEYKERKNRKIIERGGGGFDRHFHCRRYTLLYL